MVSVTALLLPALLSAVLVFVVSSIIHMATPWHAGDFSRLPHEDAVLAALRPFNIIPGTYVAPRPANTKEMGSPEFAAKLQQGPNVMMQVMPNARRGMGAQLALWFVYSFVVALFAGFMASKAEGAGVDYQIIFKFVGPIAFASYAIGLWQMSIWYQRPWSVTLKNTIDGAIYAGLTAGVFGWMWPR
jgi:hypothetical protein